MSTRTFSTPKSQHSSLQHRLQMSLGKEQMIERQFIHSSSDSTNIHLLDRGLLNHTQLILTREGLSLVIEGSSLRWPPYLNTRILRGNAQTLHPRKTWR